MSSVEPADKISFGSEATEVLINENDGETCTYCRTNNKIIVSCSSDQLVW